jgi:hypothetical protein
MTMRMGDAVRSALGGLAHDLEVCRAVVVFANALSGLAEHSIDDVAWHLVDLEPACEGAAGAFAFPVPSAAEAKGRRVRRRCAYLVFGLMGRGTDLGATAALGICFVTRMTGRAAAGSLEFERRFLA